jgi:hypothetical protein
MNLESDTVITTIKREIVLLETRLAKLRQALKALEELEQPARPNSNENRLSHGDAKHTLEEWIKSHGKTKIAALHKETRIPVPTIYYQAKKMPDVFFIENGYLCLKQAV